MVKLEYYQELVATYGMAIATKIVAAIIFWIVGRLLPSPDAGTVGSGT
jgi:hypothetical protein